MGRSSLRTRDNKDSNAQTGEIRQNALGQDVTTRAKYINSKTMKLAGQNKRDTRRWTNRDQLDSDNM